ncbi:sensor histidine kinase [Mariniblastus fucicola]|uniref:histidine kinase n=1 Tax=Mariniblastus fucicola TaxID=980251 RepID=A0A5B9PIJ6_9BACT|nr:HAMP domain-containing sensor histidine kinase [Mariniblastus fucicola]QEG22453.1 Sporulation kinase D [Mariniblastus fucicola]
MRWPLKNQILIRMLVLLLVAVASLTYASIHSTISAHRKAELDSLSRIVELMSTTKFPLTPAVLENMKLLSGAEFAFGDGKGNVLSKTSGSPSLPREGVGLTTESEQATSARVIEDSDRSWYHESISDVRDPLNPASPRVLHIFVSRQTARSVWIDASKTPLMIAASVMLLAVLLSLALANQVTRPLATLNQQVRKIAQGDVQQIPAVSRNDEIRDLNTSINEMAVKLEDHETQLRKNERLRTMVQFGSSMAHHLRNSATGCKMAIQLLASEKKIGDDENFLVALRQLELMDSFIKKFMLFANAPESGETQAARESNPKAVLENVIFLLRPSADHLNVELSVRSESDQSTIEMTEEDAQQLMMNLISNAIRAASERLASSSAARGGLVEVELFVQDGRFVFQVADNGAGPPENVVETMFDPFVTGSKEGTGLGLSLVKEIAARSGGNVDWSRENGMTIFRFEAESIQGKAI